MQDLTPHACFISSGFKNELQKNWRVGADKSDFGAVDNTGSLLRKVVTSSEAILKRSAPQTECFLSITVISCHALAGGKKSRTIKRWGG